MEEKYDISHNVNKKDENVDAANANGSIISGQAQKRYSGNSTSCLNSDFIKNDNQDCFDNEEDTCTTSNVGCLQSCTNLQETTNLQDGEDLENPPFDPDDAVTLSMLVNTCEDYLDATGSIYERTTLTNNTAPGKVYPDLLNHISFDKIYNEKQEAVANKKHIRTEETLAPVEGEEEEEDAVEVSNELPHRMHYLDNVVTLSTKRNSFDGRHNSLPTAGPLVNLSDLARLQGIHENAKGKKRSGGSRKSIGKSVLNRISKRLTSASENNESSQDYNDTSANEEMHENAPSSPSKRNFRRRPERKSVASPGGMDVKNKPSRMKRKFRRTFTSGSDKLLQQAVSNNDLGSLEKLLTQDRYLEEINYLEPPGVTIFHQACVYGDSDVIQLLLHKGADVSILTWSKLSPLKIAVMFGHFEIAELLLDSGADLNDIKNGFQNHES